MRRFGQRQQLFHRGNSTFKLEVAVHFVSGQDRQPGALHGTAVAFQTMACGGFILRAGDTGNIAITAGDQVIGRHLPAQQRVILNDVVGPFERSPVHHHDRQ
ncbi:hypothetical protein D3C79_917380 [compost metagenome]